MFRGIEFLEKDLQQPLDFSSLNHVLRGSIKKFRPKKITSSNNPRYLSQSHLNRDLVAALDIGLFVAALVSAVRRWWCQGR
jgi:hypothetical protein